MEIKKIFDDFANAFSKKIDVNYHIKLQFEISDLEKENIWQIDVDNGEVLIYNDNRITPEEVFVLTSETLLKLYNNELSPLTAFANEPNKDGIMCSLIELKYKDPKKIVKAGERIEPELLSFFDRLHKFDDFFNKDYLNKIIVKESNCIKLHNVNGIGLLKDSQKQCLHVFFSIKKNETLKQGPIEFCAYILNGKGILRVDDSEFDIEKNEYYHLKPKTNVIFDNQFDDNLDILYLGLV